MLITDLFEETYFAIFSNKVRSGLTILGIVIGIGSVIAMISIGQGATGSIETSIQLIVALIVVGGGSFYGGMSYQKSKNSLGNFSRQNF